MRLVHLLVAAVASTVAVIAVQYLRPNEAVKTRVGATHNESNTLTSASCEENKPDGRVEDIRHFNIPAGALHDTLRCFGHQAGITVVWPRGLTGNTRAINETMSAAEAADALLSTTEFEVFVTQQNRFMTIVPAMSPLDARSVRVPERLAPAVVRRT